jgi:hypothetical protein
MQQPQLAPYPISDFLQWQGMKQLELTPKFQRRDVWPAKAKSYLIDTILRKMPIPPIFVRLRLDVGSKRMIREVVDGQQRLRAVLGFAQNAFPISEVHSEEYPGKFFDDLPLETQDQFLSYKFMVSTFENVSDADVLRVFERLNTYTEPLKGIELLSSRYFGAFKRFVFDIALAHNTFWSHNRILSDKRIARMGDAEFASELIICMLDGIKQTKLADLKSYFERFDDKFARGHQIEKRFAEVIDVIGSAYGDELSRSQFRRVPLFFSLFLVLFDALYGLPNSPASHGKVSVNEKLLRSRLTKAEQDFDLLRPRRSGPTLKELSARATADATRRKDRHRIIFDSLFG